MNILPANSQSFARAVKALSDGLLVAFPTETVYGLGASARDLQAIKRLYAAKGRPSNHPVIVHLAALEQIEEWACRIPEAAWWLGRALWPGPLTMILPKAEHVHGEITGGQDSVGLRVPDHPVARELLKAFADGVVAPSANKFGRLSPTTAQDVAVDFTDEVEIILDGGPCEVGIESTIVDFTVHPPRILRPGLILADQIELIIGPLQQILRAGEQRTVTESVVRVPGDLTSHYAPRTPLLLVSPASLMDKIANLSASGVKFCVLSFHEQTSADIPWLVAPRRSSLYAHQLYGNLRKLDRKQMELILVENVPQTDEWSGVADRLARASSPIVSE